MKKAVVDRIENGDIAVVLVGEIEEEFNVPLNRLPAGTKEGSHLVVEIEDNELVNLQLDTASEQAAKGRIQEKMNRLRNRTKK